MKRITKNIKPNIILSRYPATGKKILATEVKSYLKIKTSGNKEILSRLGIYRHRNKEYLFTCTYGNYRLSGLMHTILNIT